MITPRLCNVTYLVKLEKFPKELRELTGQKRGNELILWLAGGSLHACATKLRGRAERKIRP